MLAHLKTHQSHAQRKFSLTCEYKSQIKTVLQFVPLILCVLFAVFGRKGVFFWKDLSNSNIVSSRLQNSKNIPTVLLWMQPWASFLLIKLISNHGNFVKCRIPKISWFVSVVVFAVWTFPVPRVLSTIELPQAHNNALMPGTTKNEINNLYKTMSVKFRLKSNQTDSSIKINMRVCSQTHQTVLFYW